MLALVPQVYRLGLCLEKDPEKKYFRILKEVEYRLQDCHDFYFLLLSFVCIFPSFPQQNKYYSSEKGLRWWLSSKEPPANAGDVGSIPGLGRSPGKQNGNLFPYSCLWSPMDRGAWHATVHGGHKSVEHDLATKQQQQSWKKQFIFKWCIFTRPALQPHLNMEFLPSTRILEQVSNCTPLLPWPHQTSRRRDPRVALPQTTQHHPRQPASESGNETPEWAPGCPRTTVLAQHSQPKAFQSS